MTNLPLPSIDDDHSAALFMTQVETLCDGLKLVLLVSGMKDADVVTMFA